MLKYPVRDMNGYHFEAEFLAKAQSLHITYNHEETLTPTTPTLAVFSNVNPLSDSKGMPLDRMALGSLVHLRENHTVIDAVGKLWHLSHDIVNELLEIMPYQLHRGLLNEIKQAEWFALKQ